MERAYSSETLSESGARSPYGRLQQSTLNRSARSLRNADDEPSGRTADDEQAATAALCSSIPLHGCVRPVKAFIFPVWRGLLSSWLQLGRSVTVSTSQIDADHVAEIGRLMLLHRKHHPEVRLYVPHKCCGSKKWHDVRSRAKRLLRAMKNDRLRRLVADDDLVWIFKTLIVREVSNVSCNFISCHNAYQAEILITTSTFHRDSFEHGSAAFVNFCLLDTSVLRTEFFSSLDSFLASGR